MCQSPRSFLSESSLKNNLLHFGFKNIKIDLISHKPAGGTVKIIEQPFRKVGIKSRIDTGLILEEVEVPYDYEIPSPRTTTRSTLRSSRVHELKEAIKSRATSRLSTLDAEIDDHLNTSRSYRNV